METGEGFTSVMDHGMEVSTEHLPKIPCSKFTIIGNSRMRNKKPVRKKERMWKVSKSFRRHQTEQEKASKDLKQSLNLKVRSMERKFGNQDELNRFDKNGIYGDAFQRTLDLTHPGGNQTPAPRHRESKVEKSFINDLYRDTESSLFFPQYRYGKKNYADRIPHKSGYHVSLPSLANGRTAVSNEVTRCCQGNARHYCDAVGKRYCTACLRTHRLDKLTYRAVEGGKDPYRKSKSKLTTILPKIRTGSFFEGGGGWTAATANFTSETRTNSSPLLSQKQPYAPQSWEDRKRRKLVQRSNMPVHKFPTMPDITTDTESRYLNS